MFLLNGELNDEQERKITFCNNLPAFYRFKRRDRASEREQAPPTSKKGVGEMNDFEKRFYDRYYGFEYKANQYQNYSYKDLWKYFELMTHASGGKNTEYSFRKLLKALIDVYLVDRETNFKKENEGYFYCELCKFCVPMETFADHVIRDHNMNCEDFIESHGRICVPEVNIDEFERK